MHLWPCPCDLCKLPQLCIFQTSAPCWHLQWSGRQLREAVLEQQDPAQAEAQRRATQRCRLALILPPHVLHILALGNMAVRMDGDPEGISPITHAWLFQSLSWRGTLCIPTFKSVIMNSICDIASFLFVCR